MFLTGRKESQKVSKRARVCLCDCSYTEGDRKRAQASMKGTVRKRKENI